ncbi:hypothetical protein [Streptomyces sp. NPDC102283]|uniref:hypothetical protein n=1 Tax=Streptomyces sp. NPDC102283 TaxID=3366155 RepID=UPI003817D69D
MDVAELCGGVFAGRMEKTVQAVAGGTVFKRRGGDGMDKVIEKIKEGYASDHSWLVKQNLCEISVRGGSFLDATAISFSVHEPQDVGDPRHPAGARLFSLGKEAVANTRSAGLCFECVSPQIEGSGRIPVRVRGGLGKAKDRGDAVEDLVANQSVLHSASLAVAKRLGCTNNGGLPEKLDPDPQPTA